MNQDLAGTGFGGLELFDLQRDRARLVVDDGLVRVRDCCGHFEWRRECNGLRVWVCSWYAVYLAAK